MPAANGTDDAPTAQGMGGETDNVTPEGTHAAVSHRQSLHCALYSKHDTDEKCHKLLFLKTRFSLTQQNATKALELLSTFIKFRTI